MRRKGPSCEECGEEVDTSPHGPAWTELRTNDPDRPGYQSRKFWCPDCPAPNA